MKKIFSVVLSAFALTASAQWSNTSNYFEDSLHMPVTTATGVQKNPIIVTSYPDNGYFVIWEDDRNYATLKTDIYAQKYDGAGNALWAAGGIPIVSGPHNQHYTFSSNQDYRNRSFAATDSAGGFYICYSDDSVSNYVWERATIQHIRSNGTGVFPGAGYIIIQSAVANLALAAQLIADGNKGFFIAYRYASGNDFIYVYDYKDENGSLKFYGGGKVNENAQQTSNIAPCGIKTNVIYPSITVSDYHIWGDGQGGCNIVISMSANGTQGKMLAYNRLWRAKKDAIVKTFFRNVSGSACPRTTEYNQGDVYLLYKLSTDFQRVVCGGGSGPVYAYTNDRLISNGFQLVDEQAYDYNFPKGVTLSSSGNINVDLLAVTRRSLVNNTLSDFTVQGYLIKSEIFDSIPYQRCSFNNPDFGYNTTSPVLDKLNFFRDTILAFSSYYPDFSLAAGGNRIYATALMGNSGSGLVRLQELQLNRKASDSFALEYKTNIISIPQKTGLAIGSEMADISYDLPHITFAKNGQALFYIREYYRYARVSPIGSDAQLLWGAMGKPIGTGFANGSYYRPELPYVSLDSTGSRGLICWQDTRNLPGNTNDNIFMRHLDKLDVFNYLPPIKKVKLIPNPYGPTYVNPTVLFGTTNRYTTLDVYDGYGSDPGTSPVIDILDNNYLGRTRVSVFQNSTSIRKYNNQAYLNRNYTMKTDSLPAGAEIDMLLYFTKTEFDALKAADFSIASPDYLTVVRQPSTTDAAPAAYTPVAGEELVTPVTWDSVSGGYFIKILASGTGNFFIQKITTKTSCAAVATSFASNITGATYQWQVSTGGNFISLSNDANYSGTNTATLQVNNIPSAFNGYRYRCVVDNTKVSNAFYLQIANVWSGAVNNLWENPANWSCGTVPDANTDVIVNSGTVTVNSAAVCKSLQLSPSAKLYVTTGFNLNVLN